MVLPSVVWDPFETQYELNALQQVNDVCRTVNIHLINTLGVEDVSSCIECRCPVELEMKNGGGVLCCTDCPSISTRGIIEYAMDYTTIYR